MWKSTVLSFVLYFRQPNFDEIYYKWCEILVSRCACFLHLTIRGYVFTILCWFTQRGPRKFSWRAAIIQATRELCFDVMLNFIFLLTKGCKFAFEASFCLHQAWETVEATHCVAVCFDTACTAQTALWFWLFLFLSLGLVVGFSFLKENRWKSVVPF